MVFGMLSGLALLLAIWSARHLPDFPGQTGDARLSLSSVIKIPGVRSVLLVTFGFVLAHNVLYTYVAPFLVPSGLGGSIDFVLLIFGIVALSSIWVVGVLIDRWLRELVLVAIGLFGVATLILGLHGKYSSFVIIAVVIWGLAWGGAATLFQTASAKAAGEAADVAQSMLVTVWNIAMAPGGGLGGLLINSIDVSSIPWVLIMLLILTGGVALSARRSGFPASHN